MRESEVGACVCVRSVFPKDPPDPRPDTHVNRQRSTVLWDWRDARAHSARVSATVWSIRLSASQYQSDATESARTASLRLTGGLSHACQRGQW